MACTVGGRPDSSWARSVPCGVATASAAKPASSARMFRANYVYPDVGQGHSVLSSCRCVSDTGNSATAPRTSVETGSGPPVVV